MNRGEMAAQVVAQDLEHICAAARHELEQMAGRRLLITGGAGFLGYYLVQSVVHFNAAISPDRPIELVVFDNFSRGIPAWLEGLNGSERGENLEAPSLALPRSTGGGDKKSAGGGEKKNTGEGDKKSIGGGDRRSTGEGSRSPVLTLVRHDVRHPLPDEMGHFDFVIHAASIASPTIYRQDPIGTMDANVNGLRSLLEYFKGEKEAGRPVGGFLFFSSSEIYGDPEPEHIPTPETYRGSVSCTGPRACYDEAKRYGETLCVNFAKQHGLPVKAARPFNNYGPGLKITDGRVIPDFARDVLAGREIVMLSDGRATRTFCYSADAVAGYFKVLVRGRAGEAYNIGVEKPEISMADLAEKIAALGAELFGYRGKVVRKVSGDAEYLVDNPNRRCPIIDKARAELAYEPKIQLEEGLRRSMIWYGGNREETEGTGGAA